MTAAYSGELVVKGVAPSAVRERLDSMLDDGLLERVSDGRFRMLVEKVAKSTGFDDFWKIYPKRNGRKVGKTVARSKWSRMSLDKRRLAYTAACRYARAVEAGETIAKDPERFLANGFWLDWLEEKEDSTPQRPKGVPSNAIWDPISKTWIVL